MALAALPLRGEAAARFAVVAGNNFGAPGRPKLWFAEKDADRFHQALHELGDFAEDRVVVIRGASPRRLREALAATEAKVAMARAAGEQSLLVVYYSGHAGTGGLEMGDETVSFEELRRLVSASTAEAKVAIVDACESGLLTQVKGASATPALSFPLPTDDVRGTAFIASTAVGESAQESAAIGGSFFTHHLEVGLRGAADADGDGLVTLAEAFRYTSSKTVSGTAATQSGAQHPTYEFKMSGRGDVVLSDLRKAESRLTLPPDPGVLYVLRGPRGALAEVAGGAGRITLALPAGKYTVERRAPEGRAAGEILLERGAARDLPALVPTRYELARAKGGPKPGLLYAGAGMTTLGLANFGFAPTARLGVRKEYGPVGLRVRFDYLAKSVDDAGVRYDLSYLGGAAALLFPLNTDRLLIEAGPELGYGYASQKLADKRSFESGMLWAGAAVMVTAPVGPLRVGLDGAVGAQRFKLNDKATVKLGGSLALLALWGF
jgi:hypothetical protein